MEKPPIWLRLLVLGLLVAGVVFVVPNRAWFDPAHISGRVDDHGWLMPAIFILYHIPASLLFVPRSILAAAAGLLFGFWGGLLWATVGSLAGAVVGFGLARFVNDRLFEIERIPGVGPLLDRAETGGWRFVLVTRLVPVLPHSLVNYVLGLSRIPLGAFVVGSLIGMLPNALVAVNLGVGGRYALGGGDWWQPVLLGVAVLVVSLAVPRLFRRSHPASR